MRSAAKSSETHSTAMTREIWDCKLLAASCLREAAPLGGTIGLERLGRPLVVRGANIDTR